MHQHRVPTSQQVRRLDQSKATRGRCGQESTRPRGREANIIRKFQIPATASSNNDRRDTHQTLVGDPLVLDSFLSLTIVALFFWGIAALSSLPPSLIPLFARFYLNS